MPIAVGVEAPDFVLKDQNNQDVRLRDFRGVRTVLLVFYPLAFTGICQGELGLVRDNLDAFMNESVQVLTVSVDSSPAHKVWAMRERYEFPLLADFWPHGGVATRYGAFDERRGVATRATFVIDKAGIVRFTEESPAGVGRDPAAWLDALSRL